MKKINEAIKRLNKEQKEELAEFLGLHNNSFSEIATKFLLPDGINKVLSLLESDELEIINVIYDNNDGITFSEISKILEMEVVKIEKLAANLSKKLFVYVIKNRQLLTNKMDKIYAIKEIVDFLNIYTVDEIKTQFLNSSDAMVACKSSTTQLKHKNDQKYKFLFFLLEKGGIATFEESANFLKGHNVNLILNSLLKQNAIRFAYIFSPVLCSCIVITEENLVALSFELAEKESAGKNDVNNRLFLLNNLLKTYDVISTFGLFLTKQDKFRKIDRRRITDAMIPLMDKNKEDVSKKDISQLSLYLLYKLNCIIIEKDIVEISLNGISDVLEDPKEFLKKIIFSLKKGDAPDSFFPAPFDLPDFDYIESFIEIIWRLKEVKEKYLKILLYNYILSKTLTDNVNQTIIDSEIIFQKIDDLKNFLILLGLIKIENSFYRLTAIGEEIFQDLLNISLTGEAREPEKSVYINSDFSLHIPLEKVFSSDLYLILANTEIIKDDIVLDVMINKSSIISSFKRGMSLDVFMDTLKKYSKNTLPQNLDFLLREWTNQTVKIDLFNAVIMKSSHPTFLDDLELTKAGKGIVKRISKEYAIVNKELLDDIIKEAKKQEALIHLFEKGN